MGAVGVEGGARCAYAHQTRLVNVSKVFANIMHQQTAWKGMLARGESKYPDTRAQHLEYI